MSNRPAPPAFKPGEEITLINPLPTDPFFIQYQRTVKVLEVRGDWVRAEHWPAPGNRQEYTMPAGRFQPAERRLPDRGEKVKIVWPGGPYDFVIVFDELRETIPNTPGWVTMAGLVVDPPGSEHRQHRSFYVHHVDGEWTLLPMQDSSCAG